MSIDKALKTVFHVHTDYSDDSNNSPERILELALAAGVDCIAITDHDTIAGAHALAAIADPALRVIVGEEISTREGHLIGLFLSQQIEPGLSAPRTAELVHAQGGLVIAPHPFNTLFGCSLREHVFSLMDHLDAVEVCNSQNLLPFPNRKADAFARRFGLPAIVGADVHHGACLDACYQIMPPFRGADEFLPSLRGAELVRGRHSLAYFAQSANLIIRERLGLALPDGYGRNCPVREREGRSVALEAAS